MKLLTKIQNFMYGRYGFDDINRFLFLIYVALIVSNIFLKNNIISIISLVIAIIIFYRALSKKNNQRRKENAIFLKIKRVIISPFSYLKKKLRDQDYVYKKCHHCHKTLRLPIPMERGKKHVVCPKCKKRNTFLILKKQKIEVIKAK